MKTDIVCGKEVAETVQWTTKHGDRPFFFCSHNCESAFISNPLKYIEKTGALGSNEGSPKVSESGKVEPSRS